jgi:hypothetical protein
MNGATHDLPSGERASVREGEEFRQWRAMAWDFLSKRF